MESCSKISFLTNELNPNPYTEPSKPRTQHLPRNPLARIKMQHIIDHPFFHKIENSDQPIIEQLPGSEIPDFPNLFEIYQGKEETILEEKVIPLEDRDFEAIIAFQLEERFIVIQDKNTLDVSRYNLLAAKRVSEYAYHRWWYYRNLKDRKKGRDTMKNAGIYIPKNEKY